MKNRTARFLIISIVCIFALCVVVFSFMAYRMNKRGADAIGKLGTIYMAGISEQAAKHFGTTIELRLSQVSALADSVPAESPLRPEAKRQVLIQNARARLLSYLALYSKEGTIEMLYGNEIGIDDPKAFALAIQGGESIMTVGSDVNGQSLVLMATPATVPMSKGGDSVALIAALPITYISEMLSMDSETYFFIIKKNGEFIIRDTADDETYFRRVLDKYSIEGKTNEEFLTELKQAMSKREDCTVQFSLDGSRRFLYGTSLPFSDWYFLLFLPYGQLDETVNALGYSWSTAAVMSCLVILFALGVAFFFYFRLTRKQLREIDEARRSAVLASKAKSDFLSNMSHDIRTPMNGIVGMTAIASANLDNIEQVKSCLKKIDLSSRHLLGLINDILDMSKIESGKLELHLESISLQETMQNIVNVIQPQVNVKKQRFDVYVYDIPNEHVYCDSVRFSQIMLNLLGNAVKFTPEGGKIDVACYEEPSSMGEGYVKLHLRVRDTGIGMTPEFRLKIFDAFSREDSGRVQKTEGSGLGMAITKYIVDAMHGTIEVESELGKGTEFHVVLDLKKAEEDALELDWDVLVVDPDELFCESAVGMLASIGCHADWAQNVADALEKIKKRHADRDYEAILFDCSLTEKEDYRAVRELCDACENKSVPILLVNSDWGEPGEKAKEAGIVGWISKPLFRSNLYHGLKNYCGGEIIQTTEKAEDKFSGEHILLAEDNELNREIAVELLSEIGLKVDSAEDGKICTEMFASSPEGYYEAILMDLRMPVMNGYEAAEAIRKMTRGDAALPIIAMSADAFSDDVQRCLASGMNAHVAKPVDVDVVARVLHKYIGEWRKKER